MVLNERKKFKFLPKIVFSADPLFVSVVINETERIWPITISCYFSFVHTTRVNFLSWFYPLFWPQFWVLITFKPLWSIASNWKAYFRMVVVTKMIKREVFFTNQTINQTQSPLHNCSNHGRCVKLRLLVSTTRATKTWDKKQPIQSRRQSTLHY